MHIFPYNTICKRFSHNFLKHFLQLLWSAYFDLDMLISAWKVFGFKMKVVKFKAKMLSWHIMSTFPLGYCQVQWQHRSAWGVDQGSVSSIFTNYLVTLEPNPPPPPPRDRAFNASHVSLHLYPLGHPASSPRVSLLVTALTHLSVALRCELFFMRCRFYSLVLHVRRCPMSYSSVEGESGWVDKKSDFF